MTRDRRRCGVGSHPQAGAVGVGSDHGEAISWQVAPAHREGNDAGEVPGQKVLKRDENWVYKMTDYKCQNTSTGERWQQTLVEGLMSHCSTSFSSMKPASNRCLLHSSTTIKTKKQENRLMLDLCLHWYSHCVYMHANSQLFSLILEKTNFRYCFLGRPVWTMQPERSRAFWVHAFRLICRTLPGTPKVIAPLMKSVLLLQRLHLILNSELSHWPAGRLDLALSFYWHTHFSSNQHRKTEDFVTGNCQVVAGLHYQTTSSDRLIWIM